MAEKKKIKKGEDAPKRNSYNQDWNITNSEIYKYANYYETTPLKHSEKDQKKSYKTTGQEIGMDIDQDSGFKYIMQAANLYDRSEIPWYTKFNRFGLLDPYNALRGSKEYLFFTKPDLHICEPGTNTLNPELSNQPFFVELAARYPQVVEQLQKSVKPFSGSPNPFICLLSNSVKNKLDMPEISANVIDTGATIFNTSIDYRGTAFNAGEKFDFSLEFEDTKYLEIYMFFKAYEEYEQLKKIGLVTPPNINNAPKDKYGYNYNTYLQNKELHDQFAIYKVIVDEDYEDIIFYGLLQGVFPKTAPREAFSDIDASNGLRYNIQFEANFVDDSKPYILTEFNALIDEEMKLKTENIKDEDWLPIYNELIGSTDGRWAVAPYIVKQTRDKTKPKAWLAPNTMNYKYKLKWRLS